MFLFLEKLEKDEKIVTEQIVDFSQGKLPIKILGKGELTKILTIKASFFSQESILSKFFFFTFHND